jgi:PAT family beta-lactamase induction signal transducer AmpG
MLLLWLLWRKGFVVESVRQPKSEEEDIEVEAADAEARAGGAGAEPSRPRA